MKVAQIGDELFVVDISLPQDMKRMPKADEDLSEITAKANVRRLRHVVVSLLKAIEYKELKGEKFFYGELDRCFKVLSMLLSRR